MTFWARRHHRSFGAALFVLVGAVGCRGDATNNGFDPPLIDVAFDAAPDAGPDAPPAPDDLGTADAPDLRPDGLSEVITREWGFEDGTLQGFTVGITDFSDMTRGELEYAVEPLPAPLEGMGLRVEARNLSDDLRHFLAHELDRVEPDTTYEATLEVRVASNVPSGCVGVGGPPDSVWLKGGIVDEQPRAVVMGGETVFSIEKGNQSQVGPEAIDLGDVGTSNTDCTGEAGREAALAPGRNRQVVISIFLPVGVSGLFGRRTVNKPCWNEAVTASTSTRPGRGMTRSKAPKTLSVRSTGSSGPGFSPRIVTRSSSTVRSTFSGLTPASSTSRW